MNSIDPETLAQIVKAMTALSAEISTEQSIEIHARGNTMSGKETSRLVGVASVTELPLPVLFRPSARIASSTTISQGNL